MTMSMIRHVPDSHKRQRIKMVTTEKRIVRYSFDLNSRYAFIDFNDIASEFSRRFIFLEFQSVRVLAFCSRISTSRLYHVFLRDRAVQNHVI